MKDHAPPGWVKFDTLEGGDTFHDSYVGHIVQFMKFKNSSPGICFNAVNLDTGEPVMVSCDEFVYPVNAGWVAEIRNYGIEISDKVEKKGHKAVLNCLFQQCEARKANDKWREELTKYCPSLGICSFAGPERVVKWVMERKNAHEL
jgi:hypothetical protein